MNRLLLFFIGCAAGYVLGGYIDGLTGDDEPRLTKPHPQTGEGKH